MICKQLAGISFLQRKFSKIATLKFKYMINNLLINKMIFL